LPRIGGKEGQGFWKFNFGYSSSTKVVESERRALKTLLAVSRGFKQKILTELST